MKFVVDQTLGRLAKWLRLCGYDTTQLKFSAQHCASWPPPVDGTIILTRQAALHDRAHRRDLILVKADTPEKQLAEVFTRLNLSGEELYPLKRCSRCNQLLSPISKEEVLGRVPEHVLYQTSHFHECPGCRHLFWAGSHHAKIIAKIKQLGLRTGKNNI